MNKKFSIINIVIFILANLCHLTVKAQEKITLSGTITDSRSNETLIGATVYIEELRTGVSTNEYGFYSITLPSGNYTILLSYIGYLPSKESVTLTETTKKNFSLTEDSKTLSEVVVTANEEIADIRVPEMSTNKLSIQTIKQMPVVMGEVDILKSILQLPGVTNAGEGQSGFNVRGGSADQNLVLLDEATVYNTSHFFGFFSVFNSDAVKDLKLFKGGIPARYGGRLSSVLDVYQKEGNKNTFNLSGGIGLISSRLLAEGPIAKGKGSFIVAGRSSYAHLFLKLADNKNLVSFYDLNTKISYKLNEKNHLYLSGYFGKDILDLNGQFIQKYGNSVANLRWNHLFSDKLFSNLSLIYSDYFYGLNLNSYRLDWDFGIQNFNLKYDFKHYMGNATRLTYGLHSQYFTFNPGTITPTDEKSGVTAEQLEKKYALESALYIDVEQPLSKRITVNYGVRYSFFQRLGKQNVNLYANNQAVVFNDVLGIYEKATPIGVRKYGDNEVIASFSNPEPRASVSYAIDDNQSLKVSYNRMAQYLHLISNTQSPTPLDLWNPSDNFLKPQILDQVAIGYFRNFNEDNYSLEIESFYKDIKNKVDYIDGAELLVNKAIEQVILNGKARSYGLEVMLRKNKGDFTGWVSYTLSRSEQQTTGRTANEPGINDGQWYKSNFDKLHNLSITGNYKRNEKWTFSAIFNFQSGRPATFPDGKYDYQGIMVPSYGQRNEDRLPTYHRLDLSATLTPRQVKEKRWRGEWVFSIYNVYNRQNAASVSFRQNADTAVNEAVRFSVFGIIPSVTYNFKF